MAQRARISSNAMDFWSFWREFKNWCEEVPNVPETYQPALYATSGEKFRWLIGPYCLLKKVAKNLRWNERQKSCQDAALEEALADFEVRYGARVTDVAPDRSPLKKRKADVMTNPEKVRPDQRRESDMFPKLKQFWAGKTLEAHHIVEKGIFKVLKLNTAGSPLDDRYAPCVLAFAELHRRLFTPYFARGTGPEADEPAIREQFKDIGTAEEAYDKLCEVYSASPKQTHLYASTEMSDLSHIAEVICRETKWFVG
jgi:hypothetical protein